MNIGIRIVSVPAHLLRPGMHVGINHMHRTELATVREVRFDCPGWVNVSAETADGYHHGGEVRMGTWLCVYVAGEPAWLDEVGARDQEDEEVAA